MTIKFKRLTPNAILPAYAHTGDAGMDLHSTVDGIVLPGLSRAFGTGLAAEIPLGYEFQVRPRSGMQFKFGVVAAFGTIDAGYRGEIRCLLFNHGTTPYHVKAGDRIAQMVLAPVVKAEPVETEEALGETERGVDGFGSTGTGAAIDKAIDKTPSATSVPNSSVINHPDYYRLPCGRDLEDFIACKGLDFAHGSALKYLWRAGKKNGESHDKDLAKCLHYCEAIARRDGVPFHDVSQVIFDLDDRALGWNGEDV